MYAITDREKGALPISIGTSLAIEGALGIYPEVEGKPLPYRGDNPPVVQVDAIWVNVRTLFRNLINAVDKDLRGQLEPSDLAIALTNEMAAVEAAINHGSKGGCSVVFYLCTFMSINRRFPYANHRNPNTEGQKYLWVLEEATLKELMESNPPVDFRVYDIDFEQGQQSALIITHYPVDLLNRYCFKRLALLESHTGVVKSPLAWHTKLHGGNELFMIPFDRMTLQVFGDGISFKPAPIKIRRHLIELATKYNWTAATTKAYIEKSVKDEREPVFEAYLLKHY